MLSFLQTRPGLMALLLGAATTLALPPLHLVPVLLLTFPAFLGLLGRATGWRQAAWWGALFGFGHHVTGLYWITHSLFTDIARWFWLVPLAAPGIALPLALFSVIPALAAWKAPAGWPRVLAFAGAWVVSELLRGVMFTGFPWNLLGTVWAFHALPLQPAAALGVHGLSWLTALLAALPVLGWRRALPVLAGVLALWMAGSAWRLRQAVPEDLPAQLVLVQGNVAQETKWAEDQRVPIFLRYVALTREGSAAAAAAHPGQTIIAVWPETASPFLLTEDREAQRLAAEALPANGVLLAGTVRAAWDAAGQLSRVWNSLATLDSAGRLGPVYDKAHLVPFGEYMPLGGLLPLRMVAGGRDFSAGEGRVALRIGDLPLVNPLICYEVIFPGRMAGAERPGWLLNITNDAWFGHSAGPYQHLAAARLRAVEEGLPMVRAAQTGISAVFGPRGEDRARLGLGETGTLAVALPGALPATLFSVWGLWGPAALSLLCLGLGLGAALQPKRSSDP
jgi:apolipoprotein N-acyltransferase